MSEQAAVGVDVGGTHLRVGIVAADGTLTATRRRLAPAGDPEGLVDALVAELEGFDGSLPVGVGIAGMVTPDGSLRFSPNLGLRDLPVAETLSARTGRSVVAVNDATAAAYGEQRAGGARDVDDVVLFTLGTGVGGGVIAGGAPVVGGGFAGELGHVIVVDDGRACACGASGCLEAYASAKAIAAAYDEQIADARPREGDAITASDVARAAADGDPVAVGVIAHAAGMLGRVAATLVTVLDPAVLVIGGGAGAALAPLMAPTVSATMRARVFGVRHRTLPAVRGAQLGDDAGIVGAGLYATHWVRSSRPS